MAKLLSYSELTPLKTTYYASSLLSKVFFAEEWFICSKMNLHGRPKRMIATASQFDQNI